MSGMVGNAKGGLGGPYFSWENQKATWQGMVNLAFQGNRPTKLPSALFQRDPCCQLCMLISVFQHF